MSHQNIPPPRGSARGGLRRCRLHGAALRRLARSARPRRSEGRAMAAVEAPAEVARSFRWEGGGEVEPLLRREWLATNGLGGYASGTVAGVATRRYHGILVAALPTPHG